jgi:hypothetical protein
MERLARFLQLRVNKWLNAVGDACFFIGLGVIGTRKGKEVVALTEDYEKNLPS